VLELLGLSTHAEDVYRRMLAAPELTVAGLVVDCGLAESQVRAALDELAALSLLRTAETGGLRAVPPRRGLAALLALIEADAARRQQQIDATRSAIAALSAEHQANVGRPVGSRVLSLAEVRERLEDLADTATTEVASFSPDRAHAPDAMAASRDLNQRILERGVAIRGVYLDSFRNDRDTLAYARWLTDLGGQIRTRPTVPMQMLIVDRAYALVPVDHGNSRRGAVEVTEPVAVGALCAMFDEIWHAANPLGVLFADAHGLHPGDRELLRLLAEGHTDESAARKLGLSVRTVRRTMASLNDRLGALSRFQAGVLATRHGWL
jgi:DNA-binding CsgD family transcriptional regulator/sugar-specific transcriptional regulator TrmB